MLISFTGADDHTPLNEFVRLAREAAKKKLSFGDGVTVEAGLLLFPEKMGQPRNPSFQTRHTLLNQMPCAAHLCGYDIFAALIGKSDTSAMSRLMSSVAGELEKYNRIQVNINARGRLFTPEEVHNVYLSLLEWVSEPTTLILQLNEDSADDIASFVQRLRARDYGNPDERGLAGAERPMSNALPSIHRRSLERIHILVDGSRGKGISPEKWKIPNHEKLMGLPFGIAGGLTPQTIMAEIQRFHQDTGQSVSWADLESGARDEQNRFDLSRVQTGIETIQQALGLKKEESLI